MTDRKLPRIGMRIIKSAIGVFLCYVVNEFRGGQGLVFYSLLAVLWCMQDYVSQTRANAYQRSIGTAIGALGGLVYLLLGRYFIGLPSLVNGGLVALFIVLVLYITVLIKKKQASYFSCVVFLSIVVNHVSDSNPYIFVWNRFLDTMIGIVLGVMVNTFHFPREKHTEILFVSGLDDTLLNRKGLMTDYSKVELNRMLEDGLQFTISTVRTPASLMEPLRDIKLKLPMIVMDGAALFDMKKKCYELVYVISAQISEELLRFFKNENMAVFTNVIMDDLLVIYYEKTSNEVYNEIVEKLRPSLYRNYLQREVPENQEVVYFMAIDKTQRINEVYSSLHAKGIVQSLKVLCYESKDYPGYSYLKIYNHNASKEHMLHYLENKLQVEKSITFGTIQNQYTYLVEDMNADGLVRQIKREFEPYKRII